MATYRFLPELQSQVDAIHLAQEIRGIPWNKGIVSRFTSPFRVALPLFCVAARRGERIACAMESRGLGRDNTRTFYKTVSVGSVCNISCHFSKIWFVQSEFRINQIRGKSYAV